MILTKSKIYEKNLITGELSENKILTLFITEEYCAKLFETANYIGRNGYKKFIHYFDDDDPIYIYILIGALENENFWMKDISIINLRNVIACTQSPKSLDFLMCIAQDKKINLWKKIDYYVVYNSWCNKNYTIAMYIDINIPPQLSMDVDYCNRFIKFTKQIGTTSILFSKTEN